MSQVNGDVYIREHECYPMAFAANSAWKYQPRYTRLGLIDFRQLPRPKTASGALFPVIPLLNFLGTHMRPAVWVWILASSVDVDLATKWVAKNLKMYEIKSSSYHGAKADRLDGITNWGNVPPVTILFLFKEDENGNLIGSAPFKRLWTATTSTYYTEFRFHNDAKYRIHASELRMEFYIYLLQNFAECGTNVISVYAGSKFLLAAKVRTDASSFYPRLKDNTFSLEFCLQLFEI